MGLERLHKIIAGAGVSSRRAAEALVKAGRVRVNGRVVSEIGAQADPARDSIEVDGRRVVAETLVYLLLHKPRNVVSTLSDPEGRPTVAELVRSVPQRLFPVGRLDFATSGVLLMTNDGDFANVLMHPRTGVPRTYLAKVSGDVSEAVLQRWRTGIELEDGRTGPAEVEVLREEGGKNWLRAVLREGRNHEVRRMAQATGLTVMRLVRLSFDTIDCSDLRPGRFRPLTVDELKQLKSRYGVPHRVRAQADVAATAHESAQRAGRPRRARPGAAPQAPARPPRLAASGATRPRGAHAAPEPQQRTTTSSGGRTKERPASAPQQRTPRSRPAQRGAQRPATEAGVKRGPSAAQEGASSGPRRGRPSPGRRR